MLTNYRVQGVPEKRGISVLVSALYPLCIICYSVILLATVQNQILNIPFYNLQTPKHYFFGTPSSSIWLNTQRYQVKNQPPIL